MTTAILPARRGRIVLPPNLYSGAFLLAKHFSVPRNSFLRIDGGGAFDERVYQRDGKYYTVPKVDELPVEWYNWRPLVRLHGRNMYVANKCYKQ